MKLKKTKIIVVQIALLFITVTLSGCGNRVSKAPEELKNVKTVKAASSSISKNVEYSGKFKPFDEVVISAETNGKVNLVYVNVGDSVNGSDALFEVDKKAIEVQRNLADAALEAAQLNLDKTVDYSLIQQKDQVKQALDQAQLQYDTVKNSYERSEALYTSDAISKQEFETAEKNFKSVKLQLDSAQSNYNLFVSKGEDQSIEIAETQVKQAKSSVDSSNLQLENSIVKSPINGVVSEINVTKGKFVTLGMPSVTIVNLDTLIIEVSVPEKAVQRITKGQKVEVTENAIKDKNFEGTVHEIYPNSDNKSLMYTVAIKVENSSRELQAGALGKVKLTLDTKKDVMVVPSEYIILEDGYEYIYLASDEKIKKQFVETGEVIDNKIEIINGIKEGDLIVTEGQNILKEGDKVNVK